MGVAFHRSTHLFIFFVPQFTKLDQMALSINLIYLHSKQGLFNRTGGTSKVGGSTSGMQLFTRKRLV